MSIFKNIDQSNYHLQMETLKQRAAAGTKQRITALAALKTVTLNAAHKMQLEDGYRSISIGKVSNFIILDKNPLTIDPQAIKNIKVQGTFSRGNNFPISLQK